MQLEGDRLHVYDAARGLQVIDVSEPAALQAVATVADIAGVSGELYVQDDHLALIVRPPATACPGGAGSALVEIAPGQHLASGGRAALSGWGDRREPRGRRRALPRGGRSDAARGPHRPPHPLAPAGRGLQRHRHPGRLGHGRRGPRYHLHHPPHPRRHPLVQAFDISAGNGSARRARGRGRRGRRPLRHPRARPGRAGVAAGVDGAGGVPGWAPVPGSLRLLHQHPALGLPRRANPALGAPGPDGRGGAQPPAPAGRVARAAPVAARSTRGAGRHRLEGDRQRAEQHHALVRPRVGDDGAHLLEEGAV